MSNINDIQETRTVLDEIIADAVAGAEKAGLTVYELGDLVEAVNLKAFSANDNLFITKRSFLHALGKLGWRSRLFEYTQKDRAVMEELARIKRTARSVTIVEQDGAKPKKVPNLILWADFSPKRIDLVSRTFKASAGPICYGTEGGAALNLWRAIERWPARVDVQPFLDHVAYLFPEEVMREKFLDCLAHIEQKPGVLPHAGWLHIAKNTGTGRSWLAGVLKGVWRRYASGVNLSKLLNSQHNDELAGKVLVIVDEAREGAGESRYQHADLLKTLVNEDFRNIS